MGRGHAHIGHRHSGRHRTIGKADQAVNNALRMDQHIEPLGGYAENMVGFDQFQPFIHHRSGIDGDFRAHGPVGMGQSLFDTGTVDGILAPAAERPARSGQGHFGHKCLVLPVEHLKQGIMLGIKRQNTRAILSGPRHKGFTGTNQTFLVGQRDHAALLDRRKSRQQAGRADNTGHHNIAIDTGRLDHRLCPRPCRDARARKGGLESRSTRFIGNGHHFGLIGPRQLRQSFDILSRNKGFDAEQFGMFGNDGQSRATHRSGGPQHHDAFACHWINPEKAPEISKSNKYSATKIKESSRSMMPP